MPTLTIELENYSKGTKSCGLHDMPVDVNVSKVTSDMVLSLCMEAIARKYDAKLRASDDPKNKTVPAAFIGKVREEQKMAFDVGEEMTKTGYAIPQTQQAAIAQLVAAGHVVMSKEEQAEEIAKKVQEALLAAGIEIPKV